ncbi:GGDEF and EAL domain-containing protein [Cypionkella sp.]|uniref:sensor domain-containing protein n=1 Tax=Cypionkella sp. TaxID=2811411 RepID=UPI00260D5B30|nr:GGDEF and EAL domain-containing protein [Cypionkella sp.]MDB5663812.1 diguanylate cyclase [Cypionkella sp.]
MDIKLEGSVAHAVKASRVPAFATNLRGTIEFASDAAVARFGAASRPLVGQQIHDVLDPSRAAAASSWFDQAMACGTFDAKRSDTLTSRCDVWSAQYVKDEDNYLSGFLFQQICNVVPNQNQSLDEILRDPVAAADVDELIRRELRWKTALLSANQGVWDHDFELERHFLSDTWRAMRGLSKDAAAEETTEDWLKTIHPDDVGRVKTQLALQDAGRTDIVNYTFRQRHTEGHWIWILSRGRVVRRTPSGIPARIIGTDTDISDLKLIEQERTRLAGRLGVAIEAAEMGQWELKIETDSAIWDERALQIFGLQDGLAARPESDWANLIHPDDRDATVAYNNACVRGRKDIACDYRVITSDGTEKYIRTRGKFVPDAEIGDRYVGVNLDLTSDHRKTLALEYARSQLEYESRHDALTGLANRRRLDEVFPAARADDTISHIGAMHFDIDRFKQINDNFGHDAGDAALKYAASILKRSIPSGNLVARIGGDEFVALFPQAPQPEEMEKIAQDIIAAFGVPFSHADTKIELGLSIGLARLGIQDGQYGNLFIFADAALYQAKQNGRGTFCSYDPSMSEQTIRRIELQNDLIRAFERNEFVCHYQPQFDAQTMKLSGLEALVRWQSPILGIVMPDDFLGAVKEMGLSTKLDEIVLTSTLADMREWRSKGLALPQVSVNITAARLADKNLGAWLGNLDIPPGTIVFELLESVFLDVNDVITSTNLRILHTLGIDVEIDDFGTGHASIISLLQIKPKRLKIAQEFVEPIVRSHTRRALLEAMISIGKLLNVQVVAEGVATADHVDILRDLQCDFLQGFGLGKPMSSSDIGALLAQ